LFAIRPAGVDATVRRQRWLLALRFAALMLLLLALFRPTLVRTDNQPASATLTVLADDSRSMTLTDGEGQSRWQTQSQILQRLGPALKNLDDQLDVKFFRYAQAAIEIPQDRLDPLLDSQPDGDRTDIAAALQAALSSASGRPLAGVILLGDGTSTVADSNPAANARTLGSLDVPLWTVPIGPAAGDADSRDVAVEQLAESFRVFSKNQFRVTAAIKTRGLAGRDIPVSVTLVDAVGGREEVATRVLIPDGPEETLTFDVELIAPDPGDYRIEVAADSIDGEAITKNNSQIAFLDVREGGGRIFYLEGRPRAEQLFLRRALTESSDLEVTLQLAPQSAARWPIDLGQATQIGRYDVLIIGDVDADALGEQNLRAIATAVEAGTGLLMIGGQRAFDLGGYATSPLAAVLPIEMERGRRLTGDQAPPAGAMIDDPVQLRPRRPHPITRLAAAEDNARLWSELKPLVGANRFIGPKLNPNVEVLLETELQAPILVVGQYGSGRTAAFAGDTTWQWWRQGKSELHRRFWRQLMLWLLSRDTPETDSIWIKIDSRRFDRQQPSSFTAGLQMITSNGEGDDDSLMLRAEIITDDGKSIPISNVTKSTNPESAADPWITGTIPDLEAGLYKLRVQPETGDGPPEPAEILFQVVDFDVELSNPLAEVSRLEQLAELTGAAGGRSFNPAEVDSLIDTIARLRNRASLPVVSKRRLGDDPTSGWLLMICFLGCLAGEWILRKAWGLA
jgi:uncharacterized membrane protein